MAIITSNEYDHIDVVNGSNTNRHYIKDTTARNSIEELKNNLPMFIGNRTIMPNDFAQFHTFPPN